MSIFAPVTSLSKTEVKCMVATHARSRLTQSWYPLGAALRRPVVNVQGQMAGRWSKACRIPVLCWAWTLQGRTEGNSPAGSGVCSTWNQVSSSRGTGRSSGEAFWCAPSSSSSGPSAPEQSFPAEMGRGENGRSEFGRN